MTTPTTSLVLAETISRDQLTQLAAVMLGLVVFAAIFALIERQRIRRGKDQGETDGPSIDSPRSSPPPRYVSDEPAVPITAAPRASVTPENLPDDLPVPFVPRAHEAAGERSVTPGPKPVANSPAPASLPESAAAEPTSPGPAEPPQFPAPNAPPEPTPPASPDEIGIILPDEPPSPGGGGAEPRH